MVDFTFFRSRSFLGANMVGFIVSFAMLAQFFFLALYMQNILHYTPLQAGRPVPALDAGDHRHGSDRRAAHRPHRPAPADDRRAAGGRHARCFIQSRITVHTGYGLLLPGFVLMGVGMGLVMSPMSTAAMNAVDRTKAGVASGVLSMSRMVGGTFGVAVMGALVATIGRAKIDRASPTLPAATRASDRQLARAAAAAARPPPPPQIVAAVREAFISALGTGLTIGGAVAVDRRAWPRVHADPAAPARRRRRPPTRGPRRRRRRAAPTSAGRGRSSPG